MIEKPELALILEAAIMASSRPLNVDQLAAIFAEEERPDVDAIRCALETKGVKRSGESMASTSLMRSRTDSASSVT